MLRLARLARLVRVMRFKAFKDGVIRDGDGWKPLETYWAVTAKLRWVDDDRGLYYP